ncbi:MAG: FHIPEP family type III secretion protein, partial [Pseudomonadota bacterium]
PAEPSMGDILELDDIHVEFAPDLVDLVLDSGTGLDARIANMRRHVAMQFGLILPEIRLTDDPSLQTGTYVIRIQGVDQARAILRPDHILALDPDRNPELPRGEAVAEPVYGAPARWIPQSSKDAAALTGTTLVGPAEVLATHLLEVIKRNLSRLLSMKSMRRLLDELVNISDPARAEANRKLIEELIPDKVPADLLHAVLRLLLAEQVSIRNLPLILEAIAEGRPNHTQPDALCEFVRQRLGFQIIAGLQRPDGTLPLIQLAPEWEDTFNTYQMEADRGGLDVALPPDVFNQLATAVGEEVARAGETGAFPAIVTSTLRRRFLRTVLAAKSITNPVLSFEEIGMEARPSLMGVVPG